MLRGVAVQALAILLVAAPIAAAEPAPKVIKDSAEYNAYMQALNTADPAAKAKAMEAFVAGFPNSVVKVDALEQATAAYQQAGDTANVEATARRILTIDPASVRALAIVAFLTRTRAVSTTDPQASLTLADEAGADAERGLAALPSWPKAQGVSDAEFTATRDQMAVIFEGALGYRALAHKDYAAAKPHYLAALRVQPGDLSNAYQLAAADLQSKPVDPAGFWWAARAYDLAGAAGNGAAQASIAAFAKASYHRYHGGDDGWDRIVAAAASVAAPPPGFSVAPAPTPAEIAVTAVAQNDPKTLSFSDWEYVLSFRDASPANHQAADKVWAAIEALQANSAKLKLSSARVVAATAEGLDVEATEDSQKADTVDVHVKLAAHTAPPPGKGAVVSITGRLTGYTPRPFSFTLEQAELAP